MLFATLSKKPVVHPRAVTQTVLSSLVVMGVCAVVPHASAQTIDAFNPSPQIAPTTMAIQADGKILLGGYFLDGDTGTLVGVQRLDSDGSMDADFVQLEVSAEVKAVAVEADGKILIGGSFVEVDGQSRHHLALLNADGSLDGGFADPNLDADVWAIALQPDGSAIAVGDFQNVGASPRSYAARFTMTGGLDTSFADPLICCGPARAVAVQADGRVLVGGYFLGVVGNSALGSIVRFDADGQLDAAFPVDPSATTVSAIVAAPDGSIYVGSSYATTDNVSIRPVAKLSADGTLQSTYADIYSDSGTNSLALQPDGKVVFGGLFQLIDGQGRHAMARLNANGTLDTGFADLQFSFNASDPNGYVFGFASQADGKTLVIGNFTLVDGEARQFAARVVTGDAVVSRLSGEASGTSVIATWTRSGDGPELAQAPTLMYSNDGVVYATVGPMARVANGWQATANYNVHGTPFYLKAVGIISNGTSNGSSGRIASPIYFSDEIFADGFE